MEAEQLRERIAAFQRWHYAFAFEHGISTPVANRGVINRQEQRRRYFFEALLAAAGGSLRGRRVLDLGCNAGFWSLLAVESGADFVLGIDAREGAIEQARLVFEAKQVDPACYRFEQGNVFTHPLTERFEVVLCLGLLDQVGRPLELFERMCAAEPQLIVIDTGISRSRASIFEVVALPEAAGVGDRRLVLLPSRRALAALAEEFGMRAVPLALNMTDYEGLIDYERARRLAFICSPRERSLEGLAVERRPPLAPWWARALSPRPRRSRASR